MMVIASRREDLSERGNVPRLLLHVSGSNETLAVYAGRRRDPLTAGKGTAGKLLYLFPRARTHWSM
jgi:hypothetical protein